MTRDNDKESNTPSARQEGGGTADQRQERLRAALRANLRRRKEQTRGRSGPAPDPSPQRKN